MAFGIVPPDFSVIAKARKHRRRRSRTGVLNYFTTYSEGGPDYLHALLMGYDETAGRRRDPRGQVLQPVFPGHAIGMPPPLSDGQVAYADEVRPVPAEMMTVEQYSKDVSAFLMWVAEPHLNSQQGRGFPRADPFLLLFAA
jgi:ubiquinol-cytochrome c reductase cytochrome c1 subunit